MDSYMWIPMASSELELIEKEALQYAWSARTPLVIGKNALQYASLVRSDPISGLDSRTRAARIGRVSQCPKGHAHSPAALLIENPPPPLRHRDPSVYVCVRVR